MSKSVERISITFYLLKNPYSGLLKVHALQALWHRSVTIGQWAVRRCRMPSNETKQALAVTHFPPFSDSAQISQQKAPVQLEDLLL